MTLYVRHQLYCNLFSNSSSSETNGVGTYVCVKAREPPTVCMGTLVSCCMPVQSPNSSLVLLAVLYNGGQEDLLHLIMWISGREMGGRG